MPLPLWSRSHNMSSEQLPDWNDAEMAEVYKRLKEQAASPPVPPPAEVVVIRTVGAYFAREAPSCTSF